MIISPGFVGIDISKHFLDVFDTGRGHVSGHSVAVMVTVNNPASNSVP